jgi:hypothetical protein
MLARSISGEAHDLIPPRIEQEMNNWHFSNPLELQHLSYVLLNRQITGDISEKSISMIFSLGRPG